MQLYIMRHGVAFERGEWDGDDFSRPLNAEGKSRTKDAIKVLLENEKLRVDAIWTSPLTRAAQTAYIVSLVTDKPVKEVEALACGADLRSLISAFKKLGPLPKRLMLVGHEPDCGTIIGELLDDTKNDHALKKAGIALLDGDFAPGGMKLQWQLSPKDLLE